MRRFLGKVTLVALLTFLVSVGLAFTTGDVGPLEPDPDQPDPEQLAAADDQSSNTAENSAGASDSDAPAQDAVATSDEDTAAGDAASQAAPDHLDDADADAQVLGATATTDEALAETGPDTYALILIGLGLLAVGSGTRKVSHRLVLPYR